MKKSGELSKQLDYLKRKYGNDPERLAQERAAFIQKHGMPGAGACIPMLIQMPVFFGLSRILNNAIELHRVPFLWIADLSAPDPLYVLPVCFALAMFAQAALSPKAQRLQLVVLGIVFGAFTMNFSAGLALYIGASTLFGVIQTWLLRVLGIVK